MWKFTNKYVPNNNLTEKSVNFPVTFPHLIPRPPGREKLLENVEFIMTIELGIFITDKSFFS